MDAGFKTELIDWGVDWNEILDRFMGNEDLIARFMFKFLNDQSMNDLTKYLSEGKTWTLSAAYLDSYDEAEDEYVATLTAKSGKDERSETIRISEDDVGGVILATGGLGLFSFVQTNWKVDPWKSIGAKFAKKTFELVGTDAGLPTDDDKVTLTFAASGAVTAKGEFAAYGKKYSASGSSTLIPLSEPEGEANEFDCGAVVYFPPKSGKFDGFAKIVRLHWTGEKFIPDNPE